MCSVSAVAYRRSRYSHRTLTQIPPLSSPFTHSIMSCSLPPQLLISTNACAKLSSITESLASINCDLKLSGSDLMSLCNDLASSSHVRSTLVLLLARFSELDGCMASTVALIADQLLTLTPLCFRNMEVRSASFRSNHSPFTRLLAKSRCSSFSR